MVSHIGVHMAPKESAPLPINLLHKDSHIGVHVAPEESAVQGGSSVWVLKDIGGNGRILLPVEGPDDIKALVRVARWPVDVTVELKRFVVYDVGTTQCGRCLQLRMGV